MSNNTENKDSSDKTIKKGSKLQSNISCTDINSSVMQIFVTNRSEDLFGDFKQTQKYLNDQEQLQIEIEQTQNSSKDSSNSNQNKQSQPDDTQQEELPNVKPDYIISEIKRRTGVQEDKFQEKNFFLQKFLAQGGEGSVFEGIYVNEKSEKLEVVFKIMKYDMNEVEILKKFGVHTNIVKLITWSQIEQILVLVLEKCKNNLSEELLSITKNGQFPVEKLSKIFMDLMDGLIQLRQHNILHLDIKPSNILVSQEGYYKYSDFGISTKYKEANTEILGYTNNYASPEQMQYSKYINYQSDVYSLGQTFMKVIDVYKQVNNDSQNSQLIQSLEEIIITKMIQEFQISRLECDQLYQQFFNLFMNDQDNQNNEQDLTDEEEKLFSYLKSYEFISNFIDTKKILSFFTNSLNQILQNIEQNQKIKHFFMISFSFRRDLQLKLSQESIIQFKKLEKSLKIQNYFSYEFCKNNQLIRENEFLICLKGERTYSEEYHLRFLETLDFVDYLNTILGDLKENQKLSFYTMEYKQKHHKKNNLKLAVSLINVANIYSSNGDFNMALLYQFESLELLQTHFKINHTSIAVQLENIGNTYYNLGNIRNSIKYYLLAIEMHKNLNNNYENISISLLKLSNIYYFLGDNQMTIHYFRESLSFLKKKKQNQIMKEKNNIFVLFLIPQLIDYIALLAKGLKDTFIEGYEENHSTFLLIIIIQMYIKTLL